MAGAFAVSGVLLVLDTRPGFLHSETRNIVSSVPLILVAIGYLAQQLVVRPPARELAKRVALSVAFLLWGFGQLVPDWSLAPALNDLAIGLFVFDLALITWDDHRRHVREIAAVEADAAPPARPEAR